MNKHNSKPSTQLDATPFQGRQEGRPTGSEVIIMNTDGMEPPQPGDGLIASRKNKVIAKLGDHSQLVSVYLLGYNRGKTKNKSREHFEIYNRPRR